MYYHHRTALRKHGRKIFFHETNESFTSYTRFSPDMCDYELQRKLKMSEFRE